MLKFNFSEIDLGLVSPPHFVYDFSRKMSLVLCYVNKFNCLIACTSRDFGQYLY